MRPFWKESLKPKGVALNADRASGSSFTLSLAEIHTSRLFELSFENIRKEALHTSKSRVKIGSLFVYIVLNYATKSTKEKKIIFHSTH
jgi:hypothetical protein